MKILNIVGVNVCLWDYIRKGLVKYIFFVCFYNYFLYKNDFYTK